jgi:hypothetical protein
VSLLLRLFLFLLLLLVHHHHHLLLLLLLLLLREELAPSFIAAAWRWIFGRVAVLIVLTLSVGGGGAPWR